MRYSGKLAIIAFFWAYVFTCLLIFLFVVLSAGAEDCETRRHTIVQAVSEKLASIPVTKRSKPFFLVQETPMSAIFETDIIPIPMGLSLFSQMFTGQDYNTAKSTYTMRFLPERDGQCGNVTGSRVTTVNIGQRNQTVMIDTSKEADQMYKSIEMLIKAIDAPVKSL